MSLVNFLNGSDPDHLGRYLQDIWAFDDSAIEHTHDFIQWVFPLSEKSMSVLGAPTLISDDINEIRTSEVARANLERSGQWYLGFLERNDHWISSYNHNHLRITRSIKSLGLLVSQNAAEVFLSSVFQIADYRISIVSQDAIKFWKSALNQSGNV